MKRVRQQNGGVYLDRRVNTWYYRRTVNGKRQLTRIGTLEEFPTKAEAERASHAHQSSPAANEAGVTFKAAAYRYMKEKMPGRPTTAGGYRNYLENYCIPKWGESPLSEIRPMEVWLWLKATPRAGKIKAHVKSVMRQVFEFSMLADLFPVQRNPMDLVTVEGASKRTKAKRVLTYDEWERFIARVTSEPQRTAIITCMCLGIRREEVWALKWSDFDFTTNTVMIQRAIVESKVLSVKTDASEAPLPLDESLVRLLLDWRSKSEFNRDEDWVWASPYQAGEMRLHFQSIQKEHILPASVASGLGNIGWHTLRHTDRAWLNASGTPLGIQKDLTRHSSITMTTQYGAGVVPAMREANSKVVKMVIQ